MSNILYIRCSCKTKDKLLISEYKKLGYEIRNISKNAEWRKEAKEYGAKLPFIIHYGVPIEV